MSNKTNLTRNDLLNYFIDVLGYSEAELSGETFGDLLAKLNDAQLSECFYFNKI